MTHFELYKRFRNRVAELDYIESFEVLWAYAQHRQVRNFVIPPLIEVQKDFLHDPHAQPFPWQIERLAREIVLHAGPARRRGRTLRVWNTLAETINGMRAVEEAIHKDLVPEERSLHELVRVTHQQFPWQHRPSTRVAARYFRLFDTPVIRELCQQRTGLALDKIFLMGMGLWGHFSSKAYISAKVEVEVPNLTKAEMMRLLALFGREIYEIRELIRQDHKVDDTYEYQFNHLRAFPLVKCSLRGDQFYACPVPTLLFWRFTTGLYYDLWEPGNAFGNALGASFEEYIGETLRRAVDGSDLQVIGEAGYYIGGDPKRTTDWLVVQAPTHAVFIECKTKRLTLEAKGRIVDLKAFEKDIGHLAEAVVQLYRTIGHHCDGHYPTLAFDARRQIYPVVVTMEDCNRTRDRSQAAPKGSGSFGRRWSVARIT